VAVFVARAEAHGAALETLVVGGIVYPERPVHCPAFDRSNSPVPIEAVARIPSAPGSLVPCPYAFEAAPASTGGDPS